MNLFGRILFLLLVVTGILTAVWLIAVSLPIFRQNPQSLMVLILSVGFLSAILGGLFFIKTVLSPYRKLFRALQNAAPVTKTARRNEAEFALETFQNVLTQVQTQKKELARLHQQVSQRAESAELFSERIVQSLPSGLFAFDAHGKAQIINSPAREILELSNSSANLHFQEIFQAIPLISEKISACLRDGSIFQREEIPVVWKNKRQRRFGITIAPVESNNSGEKHGALCLLADLTEIAELREQLALKQNLESLGEMSAGLAHEFKNSLAALQSYTQLLQRLNLDERGKFAANEMMSEVRNLSEMITSFLNFARPQNLSLSEINLEELCRDCLAELKQTLAENSIETEISGDFGNVSGDERMLRQTILNLLRNAAEALEENSEKRFISLTAQRGTADNFIILQIQDSGKGIDEKDLHSIFIPFFTTKTRGHGIGLALAHRVATQHGGSLTAENSPNGGAVFQLKLPLASRILLSDKNFKS